MEGADALCILTEWKAFSAIDLDKVADLLSEKVIFDGRNLLDQEAVEEAGFTYFAIGKPTNGLIADDYYPTYAILQNGNI